MGTGSDGIHSEDADTMPPLSTTSLAHMDLSHDAKEGSVITLQKIQKRSRKDYRMTCMMSSVNWRQGILLRCIHDITSTGRNTLSRIHACACEKKAGPMGCRTEEHKRKKEKEVGRGV